MLKNLIILCAVSIAFATPALAQNRAVVAVYQLEDSANSGQGKALTQMLATAITGTSKFTVIEREGLGTLIGEQLRAKSGLVTSTTPGKIGGFEGVDFLIYGSITSVSAVTKNLFGMRAQPDPQYPNVCLDVFVTLGIDIKITDVRTGEIRYATQINETQKSGTACLNGTSYDLSNLLRGTANKVARELVTTVYPMQIASVQQDGVLVFNYGEGAVVIGGIYGIYSKGESIIDPATGENLGNDEERIGYAQVTDVQGRISRAKPVGAFSRPVSVGSIVRAATKAEIDELKKLLKARR